MKGCGLWRLKCNRLFSRWHTAHEEYGGLKAQTSAQQQTARLIELVLTKGNAAAEVFRNWIQKNDVHLLRDLMGTSPTFNFSSEDFWVR